MAFSFRCGFFVLPQQFLFCRGFFVLLQLFCFAVAVLICRGFLSFAVAFLVCRDFFILSWLFGFAVTLMGHRKMQVIVDQKSPHKWSVMGIGLFCLHFEDRVVLFTFWTGFLLLFEIFVKVSLCLEYIVLFVDSIHFLDSYLAEWKTFFLHLLFLSQASLP